MFVYPCLPHSRPQFETLLAVLRSTKLEDTLMGPGPFTLFAPTNEAFAKVPAEALGSLLADKDALTAVLLRHVVPGAVFSKGLSWGRVGTAGGEDICTAVFRGGRVKVSSHSGGSKASAMVVEADLAATNGVVHAIDTVI